MKFIVFLFLLLILSTGLLFVAKGQTGYSFNYNIYNGLPSTPNSMWYESGLGYAIQLGAATPNPGYPGSGLPCIVTFDFATIGVLPSPGCHNFYFSATTIDPYPLGALNICPCSDGSGYGNDGGRHSNDNEQINTYTKASGLTLIPNPNNGSFTITGSVSNSTTSKQVSLEITDLLGQVVLKDVAPIENGSINKNINLGDNIANGVYMVRIKTDGANQVIKFTLDR